jgi:LacI family transcriptional regulator
MQCAGLEARPDDVLSFNTDEPATAVELALRCMEGRDLPTAILVRTDAAAIGIMQAARTLGIRVPEDLSVVGFNDQAEAATSDPPLTTVAITNGCTVTIRDMLTHEASRSRSGPTPC